MLRRQQAEFNGAAVGRVLPVLFERHGRRAGQLVGRTPYMQAVHVAAPERRFGTVADVAIDAVHANSLAGALVADETERLRA